MICLRIHGEGFQWPWSRIDLGSAGLGKWKRFSAAIGGVCNLCTGIFWVGSNTLIWVAWVSINMPVFYSDNECLQISVGHKKAWKNPGFVERDKSFRIELLRSAAFGVTVVTTATFATATASPPQEAKNPIEMIARIEVCISCYRLSIVASTPLMVMMIII